MNDIFSFAQILGYIASLFLITGYGFKSDTLTKKILIFLALFFVAHFYLIGAFTAATICFVNALRNISALMFYKSKITFIVFAILYCIGGFITVDEFIDMLPLSAALITCFGMFFLGGIRFRVIVVIATILWIIHNIYVGSIGGTINAFILFIISSNVVLKLHKGEKTDV